MLQLFAPLLLLAWITMGVATAEEPSVVEAEAGTPTVQPLPPLAPLTTMALPTLAPLPPPPTLAPLPTPAPMVLPTLAPWPPITSWTPPSVQGPDIGSQQAVTTTAQAQTTLDSSLHRPQPTGSGVQAFIAFITGMGLIVVMYFAHEQLSRRAELLKAGMDTMVSVDKYLLKILRNFSAKTVEDHIFRGIMPKKERVSIEFKDLCATIRLSPAAHALAKIGGSTAEDKKILTGVSGKFEAGHVAAIMGTSGAGKTTLLNLLCGKIGTTSEWDVTGTITINGKPAELSSLKNVTGFVPQDDVVHELLTVRENIYYSAELRCPADTERRKLDRITNDVLQVLQLEAQQNIRVGNRTTGGGLSGGQRKRVNVGLELAACPTLLFLDEPTSGLDATGSLMLVRQLQKMTDSGLTIVMVIHQPRYGLFTLIDDVLLLGKGGRTVFTGPSTQAKTYFESLGFVMPPNENPADWMMDVMAGQAEVDNPRIPRDQLPERLFKEWELHDTAATARPRPRLRRTESVPLTEVEDSEVIKAHLRDVWKTVDLPANTALDKARFTQVLTKSTGVEPQPWMVDELILRLEKAAARKPSPQHVKDHVSHLEFQRYLLAIHAGGSALQLMMSVSRNAAQWGESSDGGVIEETDEDEESGSAESEVMMDSRAGLADPSDTVLRRVLPGFCAQLKTVIVRCSLHWWRLQEKRLFFLFIVEVAAVFLGLMDRFVFKNPPWASMCYVNSQISMSLLVSVYSLQAFGGADELPVYWRESSHGLNRLSHFLGKSLLQSIDMFLMVFGFATAYYLAMAPPLYYLWFVPTFLMVGYVASGWGYLVSCWLPYELISLGPFICATLSFVFGGILGLPNEMNVYLSNPIYELIVDATSFTRWGVPMIFFQYIRFAPPDVVAMPLKDQFNYNMTVDYYNMGWSLPGDTNQFTTGVFALFLTGTLLRVLSFVGLVVTNRSKQV